MSWFQISEDYKASPCGVKEFPEVGWAPIIDDNRSNFTIDMPS